MEGNPLVDGGSAGLGEGDAARLETHRLGRVLAVCPGQGQGAADRTGRRDRATRDGYGVVVRDLQVDEPDPISGRRRVVRAARRRRGPLQERPTRIGPESNRVYRDV